MVKQINFEPEYEFMSFAERLQSLIGQESISGFARRVDMSEGLIRKYLKGSEPSLAKANQIAVKANCSLEWLATGCGYLYRQAEVVDMEALEMAYEEVMNQKMSEVNKEQSRLIVSGYQYLRAHKKNDGYLDKAAMVNFIKRHPREQKPE